MIKFLRFFFFAVIVKFVAMLVLGMNVRRKNLLPKKGPAIIIANHNSHLDTMALISIMPLRLLGKIHPVAAADYFLRNRALAWFSQNIIGIIPIHRKLQNKKDNPLKPCFDALEQNKILILYPEGSRGEPEIMSELKKGIAHLSAHYPDVPITPVYTHGLGKALPKGEFLLVPFFCDIFVGKTVKNKENKTAFMNDLEKSFAELSQEKIFAAWE